MSGMEVVAVIGCVAAVVSAYKDGARIVKQIRDRRAARRALAPTSSLETSLEKGPLAVERACDEGVDRYGQRYAAGDCECKALTVLLDHVLTFSSAIAVGALKDILIHLQGALLKHLYLAQEDDNIRDFACLVDASDFGRIQSVTVLMELYMRMAQAAPVELPLTQLGRVESLEPRPRLSHPLQNPDQSTINTIPRMGNQGPLPIAHKFSSQLPSQTSTLQTNISGKPSESRNKWKIFTSSKAQRDPTTPSITSPRMHSDRDSSIVIKHTRDSASNDQSLDALSAGMSQDRPSVGRLSSGPNSGTVSAPRHQPTSDPVPPADWTSSPGLTVVESNPWASEVSLPIESPLERSSITVSGFPPSSQLFHRSPSSMPYGGFCKGAYKLQVGLTKESMKLRNQSTSMTGQSNYFACASSKCAFEGPALRSGKTWIFDDNIRKIDAIQYRWTFLAKSHIALSKVKKREYSYQCVFCERKDEAIEVYQSEKKFIKHVATHLDQDSRTLMTDKVCCIMGKEAMKEEAFDVNLTFRGKGT